MSLFGRAPEMIAAQKALPGRSQPIPVATEHVVSGNRIVPPFPDGMRTALFAMGCFWGAEKLFWQLPQVYSTAVGYTGGFTPNPTYEETCTGRTGHAEAVLVAFHPAKISYGQLLAVFWENHDPTQRYRQGNDVGTQYRSAIFAADAAQRATAESSRDAYGKRLADSGYGSIATEIADAGPFYYAEDYHQQYLQKVPNGYCPVHATGVSCPVGLFATGSAE